MSDLAHIDFGPCCCCSRPIEGRVNLVSLTNRGPSPGKGWGCVVCNLPCDGAIYVACDSCIAAGAKPVHVVVGYSASGQRMPIAELPVVPFDHDMSKHSAADSAGRIRCWCGAEGTYDQLYDDDGLDLPCGGELGQGNDVQCLCGGDECVCHRHGELTPCPGCHDCQEDPDEWVDWEEDIEP